MEWLQLLITFIISNPVVASLLVIGAFVYTISTLERTFNAIHDIRKEYYNQTKSYLDMVLNRIITTSYNRMCGHIQEDNSDIHQQKLIYRLLLRDVFLITIRPMILTYIQENGFHDFSEVRMTEYLTEKGSFIYNYILDEMRIRAHDELPDLIQHLGNNFSEEEAIASYKMVIDNSLENDRLRDIKIKEYRSKHGIGSKFNLFKKIVSLFRS